MLLSCKSLTAIRVFEPLYADLLREQDALYSPERTLGYGSARDVLYFQIDNDNGIVSGIYSGYSPDFLQSRVVPNSRI